jgi:hypothetical protein
MPRYMIALLVILALPLSLAPASVRGQDATPPAGVETPETLLEVTVDRAQLPGEEGFIILGRQTFQPGAKRTYEVPGAVGTEAVVVESGALTFAIEGAAGRIIRDATTTASREEAAPVGTPFTLETGDALVYPAQKHRETNEGDEPAVVYFAAVLEPIAPPEPDPSDVGEETTEFLGHSAGAWPDLPSGPVRLTLQLASVEAGKMLPAPVGGIQTIGQMSGDPGALFVADNGALNLRQNSADVLVVALAPTLVADATPMRQASPTVSPLGTPAVASMSEVLLAATLPAEALPVGPAYVELWRSTWAPGDKAEYPDWHPAVSVQVEVVFAGEYGARSEGEIIAWRDGQFANVPLGEEVLLGAGEAAIYLDNAADQEVRNAGSGTTEIATFIVSLADDYQGPNLGIDWEQSGLSGHDVALTVERQTLGSGEALPAYSPRATEPVLRLVEAGELEWALVGPDGEETTPALRFGQDAVVPFVVPSGGESIALRNGGTEPLKLLTVTMVTASSAATPVLGTPAP